MFENILDKSTTQDKSLSSAFIANVFSYMFVGMAITAVIAWWFHAEGLYMELLSPQGGFNLRGYIVMFAPLGISLAMQMGYQRFSKTTLLGMFVIYAALLGMSLSFILEIYTSTSIALTFGVTSLTFGGMALLGYTTKTDLTKFGSIMMMAFWGIFIAGILNFFFQSEQMGYLISMISVLVFTGLTAYFLQNLKNIANDPDIDLNDKGKLAIIGGLQLYILFINLFMSLLRFMGDRE